MALFESLSDLPSKKEEFVKPNFTNIDYKMGDISNQLIEIRNSSEDEQKICNLIYNSFNVIFDDIYLKNEVNRDAIIAVFGNPIFLKCLIKVIPSININKNQQICCNKIAWDYLSSQANIDNTSYEEISNLLFQLSYITNRASINSLSVYMPVQVAKYIALARFSSFNETKNIKRVNNVLIKNSINVQDIVNIYSVLFVNNITPVFESIMFNFDDSLTGLEKTTDGNIVLAILIILENMTSIHIKKILTNYTMNYNLLNKKIRFGIRTISSGDYKRILAVVDNLETEDVYVP